MKVTGLIKRRTVANEAASEGFIRVNTRDAKPAVQLKIGDMIELDMWNYRKVVKVLALPERGTIPKTELDKYIETIEYTPKND